MDEIQKELFMAARSVAKENLRRCYFEGKIKASLKNFSDFWARDSFYAILGALEEGDYDVARQSLEYFLSYQRSDGKIPRKIALDYNVWKYIFGKSIPRKKSRGIFSSNIVPFSCMDSNSLFVIAFSNYVEKTHDHEFGKRYYLEFKKAISWYDKHLRGGLVVEYGLANWMDTIFKNGKVLYTNVLYAHCLNSAGVFAKAIGENSDESFFQQVYNETRKKIDEQFWNGSWLDDQLSKHENFDVAGNVLACYFEIATVEKINKILKKIIVLRDKKVFLPTVDPKYPWWKINPVTYVFGRQDYQNGVSWMWIDLFAIAVMQRNDHVIEARKYFSQVCEVILSNGAVHETYFNDGVPYRAKHWESAVPFAWGCGIFLKVYSEIGIDK